MTCRFEAAFPDLPFAGRPVIPFGLITRGARACGCRSRAAAPWLEWMLELHAKDLSTKRIHQDLVAEFPGASGVRYDSVRRLRETGPFSRATHGKRQRPRRPYAGELAKAAVSKDRS